MRRLLNLLILAVLIWSAYWVWGAQKNKTRMTEWILEQREQGWVIKFEALDQMGYPNRFDITLRKPSIRTPDGIIAWQGEFLQNLRLSYKPNHVIIVFPRTQSFELGKNVFYISNKKARASVITGAFQAHRIILEIAGLEVALEDYKIGFSKGQLAILREANQHKFHIKLKNPKSDHNTALNNLTISGDIEMPAASKSFPIPIINGIDARFTNLKVVIDGKTIISHGAITVSPDLEFGGQIFTSLGTVTSSGSQDSHVNHTQIEDIATPFGIRVSRAP